MSFKSFTTKAVVLGALASGTFIVAGPAEAISLGSSYTIGGQGFFTPNSIEFDGNPIVDAASGDFASMAPMTGGGFAFAAVPDVFDITVPGTGLLVDFDDNSALGLVTKNIFDFTVTSAKFLPGTDRYEFTGVFGDGTRGIGELAQLTAVAGEGGAFGYSATFTAVPTPALLPGLVGLGVAALRKRKDEATEEA